MNFEKIIMKFLDNAQTPGGVSGTLALFIAGTLCVVYFQNPADNPDIQKTLVYALTSIIGFYFGTATSKTSAANPPPQRNRRARTGQ